jgi:hypothetical protein
MAFPLSGGNGWHPRQKATKKWSVAGGDKLPAKRPE